MKSNHHLFEWLAHLLDDIDHLGTNLSFHQPIRSLDHRLDEDCLVDTKI